MLHNADSLPSWRSAIFGRIADIACAYPRLVLAIALALTLLSWLPPLKIGMRYTADIGSMLPGDVPAARAFSEAVVNFDSADEAVVAFRLDGSRQSVRLAGAIADRLVARLRDDPDIRHAFCRKYTPEERDFLMREEFPKYGLLLLADERCLEIAKRLEPARIRASVARAARRLASGMVQGGKARELVALDALGIGDILEKALKEVGGESTKGAGETPYLAAPLKSARDGAQAILLVVVQPRAPAQSVKFARRLMDKIAAIAQEEYAKDISTPAGRQAVWYELGGGYEIARRYDGQVMSALLWTLATSLTGVILIFGYAFRRLGAIVYIGIPLLVDISWTVGIGWLLLGQLNLVSCAFAAVLVGMGVDYGIHIYNRYVEERHRGCTLKEAFRISLCHTGWGICIAMFTTAISFLGLLLTRFTQLAEFGALASIGILLALPAMFFILPALIAWRSRFAPETPHMLRPCGFGLGSLASFATRQRRSIAVVGVLLAAMAALNAWLRPETVPFREDMSNLRPPDRAFELNAEIAAAFSNRNPNKLMVISSGGTWEEAMEAAARVAAGCQQMLGQRDAKGRPLLLDYESPMRFLPSPSQQRERLQFLRSHIDFAAALQAFRAALAEEDMAEEDFAFCLDFLQGHLELTQNEKTITPADFYGTPLEKLIRRLATPRRKLCDLRREMPPANAYPLVLAKPAQDRDGREIMAEGTAIPAASDIARLLGLGVKRITVAAPGYVVKTNIYPPIKGNSSELDIDEVWLAAVRRHLGESSFPHAGEEDVITGVALLVHEVAQVVKEDFRRVALVVLVLCACTLLVFYRRHPLRVILALLPVVLGLCYLFGAMALCGLSFNFINVLAVPIIIGLGVDNGIHLVQRFFEGGMDLRSTVADTGRAIVLCTLTSVCGFGSLAVGGFPGITSMGMLCNLALATNLVASLVVLPAILAVVFGLPPADAAAD